MKLFISLFVYLILITDALACPFCHTANGVKVRAAIMDEYFFYHVAATITPFIIIGIVVSMILYKDGDKR